MFTMLVLMAIVSTVITTPLLRFWMPRAGYAAPDTTRRNVLARATGKSG
jgi:hypothetical protein